MMSAIMVLAIAVRGTSLVCCLLMTRQADRRVNRFSSYDSAAPDGGNYSGLDGWGISSWFGAGHSASDSSASPTDNGGGGAGAGGDGGVSSGDQRRARQERDIDPAQWNFFRLIPISSPDQFGIT